jgi:beta propeller repeat protein
MKAKLTTVLAATFAVIVAAAAFGVAPAGATQVLAGPFSVTADKVPETNPDLSGVNLVWQEKTGSDWNIYYSQGVPGTVTPVCIEPGDQILPRVSVGTNGDVLVVWEDHRSGNADIYGYDVTKGEAFTVCDNAAQQVAPRISGDEVVWQDKRDGNWDIYGATINPTTDPVTVGAATPICTESHDQTEPDISGDIVVWVDTRYGDRDIMGYDLASQYTFPICTNDAVQDQPAVCGIQTESVGGAALDESVSWDDTVVWRDARNAASSGTDIYGYDLRTSREFAVCTAAGDQSSPAVDQDLVAWVDARSATSGLDVRGYDETLQQEFPIVTALAAQGQPTISNERVVWTDARNGGIADLWAAELTPWNAQIAIDGGAAWTRSATAQLGLFAQGKTGIVTRMTLANEPALNVTTADYWPTYSPWYLTPGDGLKRVSVAFTDLSGHSSPTVSAAITLDTHGPTIWVPRATTVKRGAKASIGYRVTDNLSPHVAVTIRLLNAHGDIVKVFTVGKVKRGTALHHVVFVCKLTVGSYRVRAWATDLAGNRQAKVGANKLMVE